MKAYSQDLRQRIVHAVEQGETQDHAAWLLRFHSPLSNATCGNGENRAICNRSRSPVVRQGNGPLGTEAIRPQVHAQPDATLQEHCTQRLARSGVKVCISTMSRVLAQVGITRKKKTLSATEPARGRARKMARDDENA